MPKLLRFMLLSKNVLLFIPLSLILGSCKDKSEEIQEKIFMMKSAPIHLPLDEMSCWINDSIQANRPWEQAQIRLVVYIDSFICTECTMNSLYLWYDYTMIEKKYKDLFQLCFIIKSNRKDEQSLVSAFRYTGLNHPIYIDTTNTFMKANPNIPIEEPYHTFLLNKNDSVVLVGDPLKNTQIKNLYEKTLEKLIDKSQKNKRRNLTVEYCDRQADMVVSGISRIYMRYISCPACRAWGKTEMRDVKFRKSPTKRL